MPETPDWAAPQGLSIQPLVFQAMSAVPFGTGSAVTVIAAVAGKRVVIASAILTYDLTAGSAPTDAEPRGVATVQLVGHSSLANLAALAVSPEQPLAWPPIVYGAVQGQLGEAIDAVAYSADGLGTQFLVLQLQYYLASS